MTGAQKEVTNKNRSKKTDETLIVAPLTYLGDVVPIYIYPSIKTSKGRVTARVYKNLPIHRESPPTSVKERTRSLPPITVTVSDDGAPNPPETPPG
ncbi:hypothetical protein CEXT_787121 [Caerostris extrusa]|uniref:Uncharacterized protein n=1 Tax=Caerostris extrusa TaxID=172846 RepID=A0AAV4R7G5_CAEEX|nr:hypothetical protein CEXT_787121 [Caerostris extrusa]